MASKLSADILQPRHAVASPFTNRRIPKLSIRKKGVPIYHNLILGSLLAGAIGDALGAAVEFMSLSEIRKKFGPAGIQNYSPAYGGLGTITDDTQMTLFTFEGMIRAQLRWLDRGMCSPETVLHYAYLRWMATQGVIRMESHPMSEYPGWLVQQEALHHKRAPGNTCLTALLMPDQCGTIEQPLNQSKGCGGVMRVAPVGFFDVEDPFQLGCECAAITHGHPSGYLSAGFLAELIQHLLQGKQLLESIERTTHRLAQESDHDELLAAIKHALELVKTAEGTPEEVESLGAGWVAEEALAISLFCAIMADDIREGLLLAVNHSGDSDSTGAITGNILGAIHGVEAVPADLLEDLEVKEIIFEMVDDFLTINKDVAGEQRTSEMENEELHYFEGGYGVPKHLIEKYPPN